MGETTNICSYDAFAQISDYAIVSINWASGSSLMKGKTKLFLCKILDFQGILYKSQDLKKFHIENAYEKEMPKN